MIVSLAPTVPPPGIRTTGHIHQICLHWSYTTVTMYVQRPVYVLYHVHRICMSSLFFFFAIIANNLNFHDSSINSDVCFRSIVRVSNRNSVAHYVAERNAIFTAISARFVAPIPLPLAPNLRLKVSFFAHQQCGILGAIKV